MLCGVCADTPDTALRWTPHQTALQTTKDVTQNPVTQSSSSASGSQVTAGQRTQLPPGSRFHALDHCALSHDIRSAHVRRVALIKCCGRERARHSVFLSINSQACVPDGTLLDRTLGTRSLLGTRYSHDTPKSFSVESLTPHTLNEYIRNVLVVLMC